MKRSSKQIIFHIIGCLAFLAVPILLSPDLPTQGVLGNRPMLKDFSIYPLMLMFFYANYFVLIPKLYIAKRYWIYGLAVVLSFGLIMLLYANICQLLFPPTIHEMAPVMPVQPPGGPPFLEQQMHEQQEQQALKKAMFLFDLSHQLFLFLVVLFFSLVLRINYQWKQAQEEKLTTELIYLKSQINPHFLFNTLNSIYSLAIEKSDYTPTAVVKLSGMMRYVLSETGHDHVPLEKEINYIADYIELQKLRLGDTIKLTYKVSGIYATKEIAPLILIPFIENAFKHGVNPEQVSDIAIQINVLLNDLVLTVTNNKVKVNIDPTEPSGLGIINARNRLELMYPGKHQLLIDDQDRQFIVQLNLSLV